MKILWLLLVSLLALSPAMVACQPPLEQAVQEASKKAPSILGKLKKKVIDKYHDHFRVWDTTNNAELIEVLKRHPDVIDRAWRQFDLDYGFRFLAEYGGGFVDREITEQLRGAVIRTLARVVQTDPLPGIGAEIAHLGGGFATTRTTPPLVENQFLKATDPDRDIVMLIQTQVIAVDRNGNLDLDQISRNFDQRVKQIKWLCPFVRWLREMGMITYENSIPSFADTLFKVIYEDRLLEYPQGQQLLKLYSEYRNELAEESIHIQKVLMLKSEAEDLNKKRKDHKPRKGFVIRESENNKKQSGADAAAERISLLEGGSQGVQPQDETYDLDPEIMAKLRRTVRKIVYDGSAPDHAGPSGSQPQWNDHDFQHGHDAAGASASGGFQQPGSYNPSGYHQQGQYGDPYGHASYPNPSTAQSQYRPGERSSYVTPSSYP